LGEQVNITTARLLREIVPILADPNEFWGIRGNQLDTYWWISFRTLPEQIELDQDQLFELGATGVEESEEPQGSTTGKTLLKGFFEDSQAHAKAMAWFNNRSNLLGGQEKIEDWDRSWRERQTPVEVTPSLVVVPPWVQPTSAFKFIIRLEAKMAFGTGSHETTRIAALLMEQFKCQNKTVLDIGTGTGLLALYAGMLGATKVLALDIDPVVGPCLIENLQLNPLPGNCRFRTLIGETSALDIEAKFDIVICNMIRTELWPFREELRSRLTPNGYFVVSGQRIEDKPHFEAWQILSPFKIVAELEMDGWWGFSAQLF
jgi:ribosomal protein L11 methyltransferase